jgi:death-on-curing family protein
LNALLLPSAAIQVWVMKVCWSPLSLNRNTYLYDTQAHLFTISAACAFHIAKNHSYNDDNKRPALQAALAFLAVNKVEIIAATDELHEAMSRLTTSKWSKQEFAQFLRSHSHSRE